jgi:hypothetical protein
MVDPEPFLNVREALGADYIDNAREGGLRTFAFHPDFHIEGADGEGKFYTMATMSVDSAQACVPIFEAPIDAFFHSVLTKWTVDPNNPDRIDPTSAREIFRIEELAQKLNAEQVMFDPNAAPGDADCGMLYVSTRMGFSNREPDPFQDVQDLGSPRGKILRLDPLEQANGDSFGVPADNPFVKEPDANGIVWARGLCHPENMTFDIGGDGRMIFSGIGQFFVEEINVGQAGANYGWPLREGDFALSTEGISHPTDPFFYELPPNESELGFSAPVAQYGRHEGVFAQDKIAIAGGYVYRDMEAPDPFGLYIFGDLISGRIYSVPEAALILGQQGEIKELLLTVNGQPATLLEILAVEENEIRVDMRFGQNDEGEVFVTSKQNGKIYKLADLGLLHDTTQNGTNDSDNGPIGAAEVDMLFGLLGADRLVGQAGDDWPLGGLGGEGDDHLFGGDGADFLDGDNDADIIGGGAGDDKIIGGAGGDHLYGGAGADTLNSPLTNSASSDSICSSSFMLELTDVDEATVCGSG